MPESFNKDPFVERIKVRNSLIYEIEKNPISSDFISNSLKILNEFESSMSITDFENVVSIINEIASFNSMKLTTVQTNDYLNFINLLKTAEIISLSLNPELTTKIKRLHFNFYYLYVKPIEFILNKREAVYFEPKFLLCKTKLNYRITEYESFINKVLNNNLYTYYFLSIDIAKRYEYINDLRHILDYLNTEAVFDASFKDDNRIIDDCKTLYSHAIDYFSQLIDSQEKQFNGKHRIFNPQSLIEHPSLGMITFSVTDVSSFSKEIDSIEGYSIIDDSVKMRITFRSCGWEIFFKLIDKNTFEAQFHFQPFDISGPPPASRMSKNFVMAHYVRGLQNFEFFVRYNPLLFSGKKIVGGNSRTNPSFMKVVSRLGFYNVGPEDNPVLTHLDVYAMFEKLNQFPIHKIDAYTKEVNADTIFRAIFCYDGIDESDFTQGLKDVKFNTVEVENLVLLNTNFDVLKKNPSYQFSSREMDFINSNPKCAEGYEKILRYIVNF